MHFDVAGDDGETPASVNSLELGEAEVQAVQGLQTGTNLIGADDPVWDVLRRLGLVQRKGTDVPGLVADHARTALPHALARRALRRDSFGASRGSVRHA